MDQAATGTALRAVCLLLLVAVSLSAEEQPPCNNFMTVLSCQGATADEKASPSAACCAALQKFHDADCLCNVLLAAQSAAAVSNIPFNMRAALEIPMKCSLRSINAPQGYSCGGMVVPRGPPSAP